MVVQKDSSRSDAFADSVDGRLVNDQSPVTRAAWYIFDQEHVSDPTSANP
jgi:hypothetical protein